MKASFSLPVRVYYEDTDAGGVVYYANYLKFMERARTEWLRSLGFEQAELLQRHGVLFAVRSVQLDYLKPARFNDLLDVTVDVGRRGHASMTLHQRAKLSDLVLCEGEVKIACLEAKTFTPCAMPDAIAARLTAGGAT
ncbi:MAG TPA: tol-pal system-associated acyl-CoA thioesterase [Burkholderiales bacterium]|nr:tol-pal system-associated acyl-CoA thioesterase [Burkholderiales bacterium]